MKTNWFRVLTLVHTHTYQNFLNMNPITQNVLKLLKMDFYKTVIKHIVNHCYSFKSNATFSFRYALLSLRSVWIGSNKHINIARINDQKLGVCCLTSMYITILFKFKTVQYMWQYQDWASNFYEGKIQMDMFPGQIYL